MSIATPTPRGAADAVAIYYLAGGFSDATNLGDADRLASLWTPDGVFEIPAMGERFEGTEELRAGFRRRLGLWEVMLQTSHPAALEVSGNEAVGRVYVEQLARRASDGAPFRATSVCDDRYGRVADGGWRFAKRAWYFLYRDEETPVAGIGRPVPRLTAIA